MEDGEKWARARASGDEAGERLSGNMWWEHMNIAENFGFTIYLFIFVGHGELWENFVQEKDMVWFFF